MNENIIHQQTIENEIISLFNKYVEILKEFLGENLLSAAIFGSFARGNAKFPPSDIDFLIITSDMISFEKSTRIIGAAKKQLSGTDEYMKLKDIFGERILNIQDVIFSYSKFKDHPSLIIDLTTNIVVLYGNDIFIEEINIIRNKLQNLGAKKIECKDSWFWLLKPDLKLGEYVEL